MGPWEAGSELKLRTAVAELQTKLLLSSINLDVEGHVVAIQILDKGTYPSIPAVVTFPLI